MTTAEKTKVSVLPFAVEMDTPQNGNVILQSIVGCRLRGAVTMGRPSRNEKTGLDTIPERQVKVMSKMPPTPGQQVHVNPAKLAYRIIDPMFDDEDLCERVRMALDRMHIGMGKVLKGLPPQLGALDKDRMKNLCRELISLVETDNAKVVKGNLPTIQEVDELPGRYLLNPGARSPNSQPRYADQLEEWVQQLNRVG